MAESSDGIDFDKYIGMSTGSDLLTVERAPVSAFAESVLDNNPVFKNAEAARNAGFDGVTTPPTFFFSAAESWCKFEEIQPEDTTGGINPMGEVMGALMANGGLILHGEQAFTYHRDVVVGEVLRHDGVVKDIYQKPTGDKTMTFMVIEHIYTDDGGGNVLTAQTNIIHRS